MESEETGFILRETQSPYETVAFAFSDATMRPALGRGACSPS